MMVVEDAADAVAQQKQAVGLLGVCAARSAVERPPEHAVIVRGRARRRQQLVPERLHLRALREEAVAADVHAVAAEIDRARKPAEHGVALEHDGMIRPALRKLVRRRQPRRPAADDDCLFHETALSRFFCGFSDKTIITDEKREYNVFILPHTRRTPKRRGRRLG